MLKVKIETKNEAFKGDFNLRFELRKCLRDLLMYIEYSDEGNLFDTNGNKVGYFKLTNR